MPVFIPRTGPAAELLPGSGPRADLLLSVSGRRERHDGRRDPLTGPAEEGASDLSLSKVSALRDRETPQFWGRG